MKQIYRTYRSLLQRIREQADTDAYVSWVEAMDARDKFLESKKQLKTDAVKAFTATEMPAQIKKIEENKNLSPQTKHTLIEMYQKFYAEYEPLLIEYYTAHEVALQAGKPEEFARLFAEEAKQIAYAQMNQLVQNRKAEEEKILNSTTPQ